MKGKNKMQLSNILKTQFAYEFSIDETCLDKEKNIFVYKDSDKNHRFWGRFKGDLVCYNNKILVRLDNQEALDEIKSQFEDFPGQWFFEKDNLEILAKILKKHGLRTINRAPFFIPSKRFVEEDLDKNFKFLYRDDIKILKTDKRIIYSFSFEDGVDEDKIGLGYFEGNRLIALAGANSTGKYMWEIGVEKFSTAEEYKGLGGKIVRALATRIMKENPEILPIYSTQFSHINSMNTAIRAGFKLGWTELIIDK